MENGASINNVSLEDNEMSVDNFSPRVSQSSSLILSNTFQTERSNFPLRAEIHSGNKYSRIIMASEHKRCVFKSKTEGGMQEVPECEVPSDGEQETIDQAQRIERHFSTRFGTHIEHISENKRRKFEIPKSGTSVNTKTVKRAGPYLLGPILGNSPVRSIVQCLARRHGTDNFYTLKVLTLKDAEEETQDDRQGKMLLHTEYSLLSLLHNQDGVIHHHGFFKDSAFEEHQTENGSLLYTGRMKQRLCLVLDCLCAHDFSSHSTDLLNLQHYVIREKKLSEKESIVIFYDTVRVVDSLHKRNIVHRDLKLGNLVLNRRTHRVTITNFCLGKHLGSENDLLKDQRGSPAYISPDVLCGKPYLGKPSDMWALGVVLFTMLYGQFPFYDSSPTQLFSKIKAADYSIPSDGRVSESTIALIRQLLILEPQKRMTASEVLDSLMVIIASSKLETNPDKLLQIVPDVDDSKEDKSEVKQCLQEVPVADKLEDFCHKITLQEQIENVQHIRQSMMAMQCNRCVGHIPMQRIGQDAREVTVEELAQYQHLLPPVQIGQPFSVTSQPAWSVSSGDTQRAQPVNDTGNTGRVMVPVVSSGIHSQPHHHHPDASVPLYQPQSSRGVSQHTNVDSFVPGSHCHSNGGLTHCALHGGCLAHGVRNLTAVQTQGNGELGQNHLNSSVVNQRKVCVVDGCGYQQQSYGNDAPGSSTSCRSRSSNSPSNQVEPVVTSVVLSNRDTTTRQQQLASFLSSLGLTSTVTIPPVPYICNSHLSHRHEMPGHAPQQAGSRSFNCARNSASASRNAGSSVQPLRRARDGPSSSVLQSVSQIRRGAARHCTISPRVQHNIVQNLSLIIQSRLEATNNQTTDDGSNGRGRN
ncbi:serine/threonine kinase SAD-1-like isoform X3 [Zootermopsis nevadensis]|nr:serine/threonine kinase SAD-1-like isoform X3 [Zootermopsis nevadensis]XP_021933082.1 serine/threonine kinase SAD-1-like isoform X3 [Zootermopsis nevadensis]